MNFNFLLPPGISAPLIENASASIDGEWVIPADLLGYTYAGIQINCSNQSTNDATITIQDSIDGINFVDVEDSPLHPAAGQSFNIIHIADLSTRYLKVVYSKGTNTTGVINLFFCVKR